MVPELLLHQMDEAGKPSASTASMPLPHPQSRRHDYRQGQLGSRGRAGIDKSEQPDPAFDIVAVTGGEPGSLTAPGTIAFHRTNLRCAPHGSVRQPNRREALGHAAGRIRSDASGSNSPCRRRGHSLHLRHGIEPAGEVRPGKDCGPGGGLHVSYIPGWYGPAYVSTVSAIDTVPQGARYVFTVGDEAWCKDRSGRIVWGIVTPHVPDWKRVVRRTGSFATSGGVEKALRLFGLSLPVNPADIKHKYRHLAFAHRPDRNPATRLRRSG